MKLLYNCFAGISGDMNLSAMLDLGMNEDILRRELSKLGLDEEFTMKITRDERSGIYGTRVDILLTNEEEHSHQHEHKHSHNHEHKHNHEHGDDHKHAHSHETATHAHHHGHRNYADIARLIEATELDEKIKDLAKAIFMEVAKAEGKVHNKPAEEVHFHEVGAVDSIVDIVGAAICYHHLGITEVVATPPELGGGFVNCQHGKMPVPAPATMEILHGIPTTSGATNKEMTTPTGAAILKVFANSFTNSPDLEVSKVGYGVGHRKTEIPNLLRVCQMEDAPAFETVERMVECNIDDMPAERIAYLAERLMEAGAKDVTITPVMMKKGRPAHKLSILTGEDIFKAVTLRLVQESSTIGYRHYPVTKVELKREETEMFTPWGSVRQKTTQLPDGTTTRKKWEYEDIRAIAKEQDISLEEAYAMIDEFTKSL